MLSIKSRYNFQAEKCFKASETKEEREIVYFQIAVNLSLLTFQWSLYRHQFSFHLSAPASLTLYPHLVNSDCDKINTILPVISVNAILVKLLRLIWGYFTSFVVCQSICLLVYIFKSYAFHIILVLHIPHFYGTWIPATRGSQ